MICNPLIDASLISFLISNKKEACIQDCWDSDNQTWNLGIRRVLFDREFGSWVSLIEKLNSVRLGPRLDKIIWKLVGYGRFSSRSMTHDLSVKSSKINAILSNLIWKHKCLKKVKIFLWSLAYRSLNTDDKLQGRLKN